MKKMKIIIASRRLNSRQSAPKCNVCLATALAKIGCETHVLTTLIAPDAHQELKEARVVIHKAPRFSANNQLSPFLYTRHVQKLKNSLSADMVFGNGYTLFDDVTWVHFSRLARIARLGSRHWKLYVGAVLEKLLYGTSRLLLAPSSLVAEDLRKLYGLPNDKIVVQPHGVDTEHYRSIAEKRKGFAGTEDEVCLLFVGADPIRKGFHLLLRSLGYVRDRRNLKLIAVGFDPDQEMRLLVEKLGLRRIVTFEKIVTTEKLEDLYQSSDIFVLPSLYDPFSIAALEAMASGLPVVVSHYTGVKDVLCNWHDSVLVDPFDINEFAEALSILAHDDKLRRKIGTNARHTAQRFSWENVAKNMLKTFEKTFGR